MPRIKVRLHVWNLDGILGNFFYEVRVFPRCRDLTKRPRNRLTRYTRVWFDFLHIFLAWTYIQGCQRLKLNWKSQAAHANIL